MNSRDFRLECQRRSERLRQLSSVISPDFLRQWTELNGPRTAVFHLPDNTLLRGRTGRFFVSIDEWYGAGDTGYEMTGCHYVLAEPETRREVLAFHRHAGRFPDGHYHLGPGAGALLEPFHRAHIPAPAVSLESFIEMLVLDFGIRPLRTDWQDVLSSNPT